MKALEAEIAEIKKELARIDEADRVLADEAAARTRQADEAKGATTELEQEIRAAYGEREAALLGGQDVGALSTRIRDQQERLELRGDELEACRKRLAEIEQQRRLLAEERAHTTRRVYQAQLRDAALRYNVVAEPFAAVAAEIAELREALGEPPTGLTVLSPAGFLELVPRIFIPATPDMLEIDDPEKQVFFEAPGARKKERRAS